MSTENKTSMAASLFWIGPAEGRTMEDAMKPDMNLVHEMRDRKIKVTDILNYICDPLFPKNNVAVDKFIEWYEEHYLKIERKERI